MTPCTKRVFGSARAAKEHNHHARFRLHVYWCDECHGYHASNGDKSSHQPKSRDPQIDKLKKQMRRKRVWK